MCVSVNTMARRLGAAADAQADPFSPVSHREQLAYHSRLVAGLFWASDLVHAVIIGRT